MADVVTSQKLIDGARTTVMAFTNVSDGSGESAVAKVDASALQGMGGPAGSYFLPREITLVQILIV